MTLDPDRDGWWDIRTAIMRTSSEWWPELMAAIRRDLRALRARSVPFAAPEWWSDDMAPATPPPCQDGRSPRELTSALAVNLAVVERKFRDDLYEGKRIACGRPGSSLAHYRPVPPWSVVGIESWWKGGGILRLESGELLYTARIEPPGQQKQRKKGGSPCHQCREAAIAAATDYLIEEGGESESDAIKRTVVFLRDWISRNDEDGGPSSRATIKTWAEEAVRRAVDTKRQ